MKYKGELHPTKNVDWKLLIEPCCSLVVFEQKELVDPVEKDIENACEREQYWHGG